MDNNNNNTHTQQRPRCVGECQRNDEAIRDGRRIMMHTGPRHYLLLLVASGSVDPRPAPNCQLKDKLEKLQGPAWASCARRMLSGQDRDGEPGSVGGPSGAS